MPCWDDILPKRNKDELEPLGVCHEDRKRKSTHTVAGKSAMTNKQTNKIVFFVWWWGVVQPAQVSGGGWATDKPVVVGKDTQTRQR